MKELFHNFIKALRGDVKDFTIGSVRKALFMLAIPMIFEMIMESLFAITDLLWVSQLGSDEAIATIGITESFMFVVMSVALGICSAAIAVVGRRTGEKNEDQASYSAVQAIFLALLMGLLIGLPAYIYSEDLLRLMGATEHLIDTGLGYTQIILGLNGLMILLYVNNAIFRGVGDATRAMRTLWIANGLNILIDPFLIFGWWFFPELGLEGAAIATCFCRGLGVCYQMYYMFNGEALITLALRHLVVRWDIMLNMIRVAVGGAGQHLITTASWIFLVRIISEFGNEPLAGYTIAMRIIMFTLLPSWGLAMAASTLVGQNIGADKPDRAERSVWIAARYNMYFLLALSILFLFFAHPVVLIFSQNEIVIDNATLALRVISAGYIFYAYEMVLGQAFNGAGDTYTPTVLNVIAFWLIKMPLAYLIAIQLGFGPIGVYLAVAISSSILAVMAVVLFKRGRWKTVQV